jgi:hypothetical protein
MRSNWIARAGAAPTLLLLLLTACSTDNLLGPDNQLEVTNNTDTFQAQASNMVDITQTLDYTWQNTGTTADINQSGAITSGSGTLRILDADGTQVYSRSLTETGTFATTTGTSGAWSIEVDLSSASGALNFRVQKP